MARAVSRLGALRAYLCLVEAGGENDVQVLVAKIKQAQGDWLSLRRKSASPASSPVWQLRGSSYE